MNCENCLHYEECSDTDVRSDYSDKSEWVHLPCKDGDRVFSIVIIGGEAMVVADRVSGFIIVGDTVSFITNWYLDGGEWGYNIFLTQEGAEKALKERRKKH